MLHGTWSDNQSKDDMFPLDPVSMVDTRGYVSYRLPYSSVSRRSDMCLLFPHPALDRLQFLFRHLLALREVACAGD
jgi:hypothetical protein